MSTIIRDIIAYLDLGKRIAVTIPGMVLALGLIFMFGRPPDVFQQSKLLGADEQYDKLIMQARLDLHNLEQVQRNLESGTDLVAKANALDAIERQKGNIDAWQKERADLAERRKKVSDFDRLIPASINSILLFGLLGFAIGTVLDPVNKAIFLQLLPSQKPALAAISGYNLLMESSKGVVSPAPRLAMLAATTPGAWSGQPPAPRTPAQLAAAAPAQFYIGRGLLTQVEYDGFIADYYRFSEVSIGMILPTLIVAAGLVKVYGYNVSLSIAAALALSVFFYRTGIRRYGEFRFNIFSFIAGREEAQLKQEALLIRQSIVAKMGAVMQELDGRLKGVEAAEEDLKLLARELRDILSRTQSHE